MLSLSILIVLHEMGHFFPARMFGTRVEKFYLFFDPWFSLFKAKKINGIWQFRTGKDSFYEDDESTTEYGIGWLPLGGYVKISGMIDESFDREQMAQEPQPWEFRSKPAWQRLIIMLGGVTVNFILGFFIFGMVLWAYGEEYLPTANVTEGIYVDSLGQEMGLRSGDKIISVGGVPFEKFNDRIIIREIIINDAKEIVVNRDGKVVEIPIDEKWVGILSSYDKKDASLFYARIPVVIDQIAPKSPAEAAGLQENDQIVQVNGQATPYSVDFIKAVQDMSGQSVTLDVIRNGQTLQVPVVISETGTIGIAIVGPDLERQEYSLAEALPAGVTKGWQFLVDQIKAFIQIFKGKIKTSESLGGFGSIGKMFGTEWNWERFWTMTAILSLILAFMNLLPIPALDGGHVMFLLYEVVSGRKPSDKFMEYATIVGFVLVIGLVLYVNGLDLFRWIFK